MDFEIEINWYNIIRAIPLSIIAIFIWYVGTFKSDFCEYTYPESIGHLCFFGSDLSFGIAVFILILLVFLVLALILLILGYFINIKIKPTKKVKVK